MLASIIRVTRRRVARPPSPGPSRLARVAALAAVPLATFVSAPSASAQTLGSFSWQVQPYCNVVTVTVTQVGPTYRLEGYDDQCGAATRASVIGTAYANPDGTIGMGLNTVVAPGGAPVHLNVAVSLPSINGTWRDSAGNTGPFAFNPALPAPGAPRPLGGIGAAAINPAQVQQRVLGTCVSGESIRTINQDGSVVCDVGSGGGDITGVTAGTGLTGGGTSGAVVINAQFGGPGTSLLIARADHDHRVGVSTDAVTAAGFTALDSVTTGIGNTAFGYTAGTDVTTGNRNTAIGSLTFDAASTGDENTALGASALGQTTTGSSNTAVGFAAAFEQTTGIANTAVGWSALRQKGAGDSNVAVGYDALRNVGSGNANIAVGRGAGEDVTAGSFNIFVGNDGDGVAAQNNTMRLGDVLQSATYIYGIDGAAVDGATDSPVVIDANNKLGTTVSSRRFKYDITDLAPDGVRLHQLRPVAFRYLPDQGRGDARQFGLIAEEVAEAMPEMAVMKDGRPFSVRYQLLPPLLLAEVQRLERERAAQTARIEALEHELAGLRTLLEARERR